MNGKNILIADDEALIRKLVKDFLKKDGFNVVEAENGEDALNIFFQEEKFSLVIIDVMMPKCDGWTVCREIRNKSTVPIIMLTAREQESDEIFGFELGADEYITKPFSVKVLMARVHALLKRSSNLPNVGLCFDGLEINELKHVVKVDDEIIDLSPKEYELLLYMVKNVGAALSREQILNSIWGYDYFGDGRTVDTHIKRLRIKLGNKDNYIQTVRGMGYRFEVI